MRCHPIDVRIWHLALPTLGALVAPPIFILIDTSMVGHLGTPQLAGLALASTLVTTVVGLLVFLAYATTAKVAQQIGAGNVAAALRSAVDGIWFAGGIGVMAALSLAVFGAPIVRALGSGPQVANQAVAYLWAVAPAIIGMLVNYAATGALRGLSQVRFILWISLVGALSNVVLNALFIYGFNLGVAGSGLGTSAAELIMAITLVRAAFKQAPEVSWLPTKAGLRGVGVSGWPLFVRTVSLRIAVFLTVLVATRMGQVILSGHQIVVSWWMLMSYVLDAVGIAAQTLIGEAVGAHDQQLVRNLLRRCIYWGIGVGLVLGIILGVTADWLPIITTSDSQVHKVAAKALLAAAICLPAAGVVYILDGVLIGAGQGKYLALTGIVNLITYLPFLGLVIWLKPQPGLVWLWISYTVAYMGSRAFTLLLGAKRVPMMTQDAHLGAKA